MVHTPITVGIEFITSLQAQGAAGLPGTRQIGGRRVEWTGKDMVDAFRGMRTMIALA